jgi:hypothetical protein
MGSVLSKTRSAAPKQEMAQTTKPEALKDDSSPKLPREFGDALKKEFQFGPGWRNLNHGEIYPKHCVATMLTPIVKL